MLEGFRGDFEDNVVPLVRDIVEDTQKLLRQEFALAKIEVREDAQRARNAVGYLLAACVGLGMSAVFLGIAAAHAFVAWFPELRLWQSFGIVALVSAVFGAILMRVVVRKTKEIRVFPEQTLDTLREGVEWIQRRAM